MLQYLASIRRSDVVRSVWLVSILALPLAFVASGCGDSVSEGPRMVKDPAPAPEDEQSSDNMPNSSKTKAKFSKSQP